MKFPPLPPGGNGHDWVELRSQSELCITDHINAVIESSCDDSVLVWKRFDEYYANSKKQQSYCYPTHFCRRCKILVPSSGVSEEDEECDPLVVQGVMES